MYYASFFPPAVRPFDGRGPLDGVTAAAAAAALAGSAGVRGERGEIPLDLSLKHVRPDGPEAAAAEELLLLEHRKLAAAYGRHLLDPAAFLRIQHYQQRVAADAFLQQAFGSAAAAQHHAMAAARLGCLDQQVAFHSAATARAAAPSTFLEPAAALALSMRGAGAPALAPGDLARSLYPPTAATALPAGYSSMFADMMPKPDPCRLADDAKAGSYPRTNGVSASAADKASSSSSYIADPVRYAAEHMQRLQESQTSAKFASTSGSAQTTSTSSTSSSSSSREHKKSSSNRHATDTSTSSASSSTAASNAAAAAAAAAALNLLGPRPSLGGGLSSAFGETVKREDYLNAAAHLPFYPGWGLPPIIPPPTTTPLLTTPSPQKKKDSSSRSSDRSSSESRNNSRSSSSHHGKSSKRSSSSFSSNNVDHHQHHQHISDVVVIDEEQRSRLTSSLRLGSSSGGRPPPPPEPERAKMPRLEAMQPPDEAKTSHAGSNDGGKRPAAKSPLSPPPLIAAVPPATSPKTAEPSAAPGALLLGKPTLPAASTTSATAASLHGKQSNHHHSKLTTPHDEKPTLNFFFRDHKAATTAAAPSSVASVPRTTAADIIAHAHQAHLQYLQQLHSSNGGHVLPPSSALPAMEAPSAFGVASPVKEESPRSAHHHHHHLPATTPTTTSTVTPGKDATAAHAKSSPPPPLDRAKEPRTVEATTVRIQKENGGVRYSIHPKKRKLDSDEQSPPATPCSVLAASSVPASSEGNDASSSRRRASRSPERSVESSSRRRPQSHSADSVLSSLRPELRQRRIQYHAVRRRKLRSGLDMIRRRKRTSTTTAAKLAGRNDRKPFGELNCSAPPDLSKIPLNKSTAETVLHRAARLGHVDLAWCCLESREGGSVESCDVNGQTPLHEAASRGHLRVGRALLQCGADPNACAHNGRRPLHDAVEKGHVEMVRLLLSYGADAMITTGSGLSPLELARSPIMVELLRGFLSDMAGESIDGSPVLPWHFAGTASLMDPKDTGFDVLAGAPAEDSGDDMLFQVSELAQIATYRLSPHLAGTAEQSCSECVRLDDVLQRLRISAEEFRQRFPAVEVLVLPAHELRAKTTTPWLDAEAATSPHESSGVPEASSSSPPSPPQPVAAVAALRFDATVRSILGLHNPIPR